MYEVTIHSHGRPVVKNGPMAGCLEWPKHQWTCITPRLMGLAKAKALADAQECHAVVTRRNSSETVYDNGKPPALPDGWYPPEAEVPDWTKWRCR